MAAKKARTICQFSCVMDKFCVVELKLNSPVVLVLKGWKKPKDVPGCFVGRTNCWRQLVVVITSVVGLCMDAGLTVTSAMCQLPVVVISAGHTLVLDYRIHC
jgi:anti-sigma-K factor RskA